MVKKLPIGTSALHAVVAAASDLAPTTRDKYLRDLNAWISFAGAHSIGWTQPQAQAFYDHLLAKGLRVQSANRLMASVQYAARSWANQQYRPELYFAQIALTPAPRAGRPQPKIRYYDGHVSTRYEVGTDGTCALFLRASSRMNTAPRLTGYGGGEHEAAMHLVSQLRLYADWIAHAHDLPIVDETTLREQVELRTGRPMTKGV